MAVIKRLLYVDTDGEARLLMQDLLAPHQIDLAVSAAEAHALVRSRNYDLFVVCGGAGDAMSIELCAWLQRVDGRTPIVFCSSDGSARHQQAAIAAGAVRYLVKPLDPTLLRSTLGLLLKLAEIESARAMTLEQKVIMNELRQQSLLAREAIVAAHEQARLALESMLRAKAYRAFREAGGNRANFERMWPSALDAVQGASAD